MINQGSCRGAFVVTEVPLNCPVWLFVAQCDQKVEKQVEQFRESDDRQNDRVIE